MLKQVLVAPRGAWRSFTTRYWCFLCSAIIYNTVQGWNLGFHFVWGGQRAVPHWPHSYIWSVLQVASVWSVLQVGLAEVEFNFSWSWVQNTSAEVELSSDLFLLTFEWYWWQRILLKYQKRLDISILPDRILSFWDSVWYRKMKESW